MSQGTPAYEPLVCLVRWVSYTVLKTAVVIVAAGRGTRIGGDIPKQYRTVGGKPMLAWSLDTFASHPVVDLIQVVIDRNDRTRFDEVAAGRELLSPVIGGTTRQESVRNGLLELKPHAAEFVLIHDAARPFVQAQLLDRLIDALKAGSRGVIPVLPVADTVKICENSLVTQTLDRSKLFRAQTPQGFRYNEILDAHLASRRNDLTDDSMLAEEAGIPVTTIDGDDGNFKVTVPRDLQHRSEQGHVLETRVGTGFDVHAFAPGDHVTLCGVKIEHNRSLAGDTDADVGLHVLTDAILGALAEGDLGSNFGTGDPYWQGRASDELVNAAMEHVHRRGARITNVDVTLICQEPRLSRHQTAMKNRIAEIIDIDLSRVNVKVTSTDRLGFTGRAEGIAGQAVVTISCPAT